MVQVLGKASGPGIPNGRYRLAALEEIVLWWLINEEFGG
jgi:hypothetical protein